MDKSTDSFSNLFVFKGPILLLKSTLITLSGTSVLTVFNCFCFVTKLFLKKINKFPFKVYFIRIIFRVVEDSPTFNW